jgi:hypothetical protein
MAGPRLAQPKGLWVTVEGYSTMAWVWQINTLALGATLWGSPLIVTVSMVFPVFEQRSHDATPRLPGTFVASASQRHAAGVANRTCSTEAEIRRHCAFEALKEISFATYRRIPLTVSTIR